MEFFLESIDATSSGLKRNWTIWLVVSAQLKSQHLWWHGGTLLPMEKAACTEIYIQILSDIESHTNIFLWNAAYISTRNAQLNHASIVWLHIRRVQVLNWPVCSPDLYQLNTFDAQ